MVAAEPANRPAVIEDLRTRASGVLAIEADVCIVGTGAAGATIARELIGSGMRVCVLEGGGETLEADAQMLNAGECVGHPMPLEVGRYRVFGGATTQWTGRCAKLDGLDFAPRAWLPLSGWPIEAAALERFYPRAQKLCGFRAPWADDARLTGAQGFENLHASDPDLRNFVWRYAPIAPRLYVDWGKAYGDELERARDVRVLLHANVTGIENEGGRATRVIARGFEGGEAHVTARLFVLCCGGIENARLLLASPLGAPGGPGNRHDQVGRYFMQHPRGRSATLETPPDVARRLQAVFNIMPAGRHLLHEFGFSLSQTAQEREGLLNCSAVLNYEADPDSSWEAAKSAFRDISSLTMSSTTMGRLRRSLSGLREVSSNLRRRLGGQHAILDARDVSLVIDLEQELNSESRVTLADRRDALGQPLPRIDWRVGDLERRTARRLTEAVAAAFERRGLGKFREAPWLSAHGPISGADLTGTYHHLCTTRMAADPRHGAVNADCRLHGAQNVYLAGASVFATGGHANPTLTIVALALRLAEHLKAEWTRG